jgi:Ribbon-helix-helix protein, copG family
MRRTQLYLDDDLWLALRNEAERQGTTVSSLVREVVRERYLGNSEERRKAMMGIIGIRADLPDEPDTETIVRDLRKGTRLDRLMKR